MVLLEAYPQTLEPRHAMFLLVFFLVMFLFWALRKLLFFSTVWRLVVIFFLVLFGTVLWNNIKGEIKDLLK